jgi:hypothetical protein
MLLKVHHINKLFAVTVEVKLFALQENINIITATESNSNVTFHIIIVSEVITV